MDNVKVTFTVTNEKPGTIWNTLARKLGREPTNAECKAEIYRILDDAMISAANEGKLPHQRKCRWRASGQSSR